MFNTMNSSVVLSLRSISHNTPALDRERMKALDGIYKKTEKTLIA